MGKKRRVSGTGTLIKTSTGLYMAKWMWEGKVFTKSTKTYDKKEAKLRLAEFTRPFQENTKIGVLEHLKTCVQVAEQGTTVNVPLSNLWECYKNKPETDVVSQKTEELYRCICKNFYEFMKLEFPTIHNLGEVTSVHVGTWLGWFKKHYSVLSYNQYLMLIKVILKSYFGEDNPAKKFFPKGYVRKNERRALTDEELKKIFVYTREHERMNVLVLMYLLCFTGMRVGDCCKLRWTQVDMENGFIRLIPSKTARNGRMVTIPICDELMSFLKNLSRSDSPYVSERNYQLYKANHMWIMINRVFNNCGIKQDGDYLGAHLFRHTYITRLVNAGVPMLVVQQIVGHSTSGMVSKYYHLDMEVVKKAVPKITVG